ncbi:hypothetical protein HU200_062846 [Digitaria exilis]|uniref:Pectinesterase inhibitor domain-containing protein n=1 Tax=Digitaria exilis TaxID=1010633 RepID=A0A835A4Z0_9POAL|nr:hypothetical protein HU200_062846 [Digitaria exilis]
MDELASPKKEKKEKSDDSDVSAYLKKQKKKSGDSDELESPKKEKKEKSDESSKKKNKSDGSDEYVSPKKEKKEKSDDDLDKDSSSKKEKKEKSIDADASAYVKKEKKEKAKKKEKSNDYSKDKEKSDEDAMPVDVSSSGEYVSSPKEDKSNEDATPVDVSTSGQYVSSPQKNIPDELPPAAKSSTTSDAYSSQPIGGSPDELPPATKSSTTSDAYSSQPMGGAPDELPPATKSSATTSDAYASPKQYASQQPMGGAPDELPPATKSSDPYAGQPNEPGKPKVSVETFGGMIKKPLMNTLSPVIKRVCGRTSFPDDCEASIADLPGGGVVPPQTDAIGVLKLAMEAVKQKAIEAMNAATDRMNAPGIDPIIKEVLDSCTSAYSDIKSSLDVVDAALKRGDFDTARTNLDSVETDVGTCDDGFAERETPSVMSDHDVELKKLGSDLIAIGTNFFHH